MDYRHLSLECIERVALITLNRPQNLKAYTPDMGDELVAALRTASADDDVGAIVLTGNGRAFCAGADRAYLTGKGGRRIGEEGFLKDFAGELATMQKPLIAAVNGLATGIGTTMTLPFDIRLMASEARLEFPFVTLGVAPGFGSSYFLPRLVGLSTATHILLCHRTLDAQQAQQLGLVAEVVPAEQLLPRALTLAKELADAKHGIVALCKELLRESAHCSLSECQQRERDGAQLMASLSTTRSATATTIDTTATRTAAE
jgi:enoyl-CoA hydratase/carnithine racemase